MQKGIKAELVLVIEYERGDGERIYFECWNFMKLPCEKGRTYWN